jgi:hypothetical protein
MTMDAQANFDAASAQLWPLAWAPSLLQLQRTQVDLLLLWQQQIVAMQQELVDQWTAHWAGGVPIDA